MSLTPEDIKQQTRQLWKTCFNDSDEFLDIYFEEKYTDECNFTLRPDGCVRAAMQFLPYRATIYGNPLKAGYVSGLCVHPDMRRQGMAARLLHEAHRSLHKQGGAVSFLIPGDEKLRTFYEKPEHGAYWTATYRLETELEEIGKVADDIEITRPDDWNGDLYFFLNHNIGEDFMLHPGEGDFFAALATTEMEDGYVLVARRKQRIVGLCLAVPEADGRIFIRFLFVTDVVARDLFIQWLKAEIGADKIFMRVPVPGSVEGAEPYAMARVVNVRRFFSAVLKACPDLHLHIGVENDLYIPENNGYYIVANGRVAMTDEEPESITTPGGLAALFLSLCPTCVQMMLDE